MCASQGLVHRLYRVTLQHRLPESQHRGAKPLAILRILDRTQRSPQEADPVAVQDPRLGQGQAQIQCRLSAERYQQTVRSLLGDDRGQVLEREWLDVDAVGD